MSDSDAELLLVRAATFDWINALAAKLEEEGVPHRVEAIGERRSDGLWGVWVPKAELDEATAKLCKKIATKSPVALAMGKEAVNMGLQADLRTGLSIEARCFCMCFGSEDRVEGMNAFMQKRKPEFKGR